jgi:hypothetical protein
LILKYISARGIAAISCKEFIKEISFKYRKDVKLRRAKLGKATRVNLTERKQGR